MTKIDANVVTCIVCHYLDRIFRTCSIRNILYYFLSSNLLLEDNDDNDDMETEEHQVQQRMLMIGIYNYQSTKEKMPNNPSSN